jgi:hypothetical protein
LWHVHNGGPCRQRPHSTRRSAMQARGGAAGGRPRRPECGGLANARSFTLRGGHGGSCSALVMTGVIVACSRDDANA